MLSIEDRLELSELPGRYGNAIDDRDWDSLVHIFTADAVFDVRAMGVRLQGLDEITDFLAATDTHPLAHLMTNVVVDQSGADTFTCFRAIFPVANDDGTTYPARIRFGCYYDRVKKTQNGWRVADRLFVRTPSDRFGH